MTKTWDPIWEDIYSTREWGKYPPEELVRFVARNFYASPDRSKVKMLDLGCGTGAATWYVAREGFGAFGIDGSLAGIEIAQKRFQAEGLVGEFLVGDISSLPYADASFDAAIDIASIQHNEPDAVQKIVDETRRVLKPGGTFFGMLIAESQSLANWPGMIHYFTIDELEQLFAEFSELNIEYVIRTEKNRSQVQKFWIVEAMK